MTRGDMAEGGWGIVGLVCVACDPGVGHRILRTLGYIDICRRDKNQSTWCKYRYEVCEGKIWLDRIQTQNAETLCSRMTK